MVSVDEPEPDTPVGFQDAEVADGKPLMLNETAPVKPEVAVTVTVSAPLLPRAICNVVGEAEREKSPIEVTLNVTLTE
jgi:hypothetical protein